MKFHVTESNLCPGKYDNKAKQISISPFHCPILPDVSFEQGPVEDSGVTGWGEVINLYSHILRVMEI